MIINDIIKSVEVVGEDTSKRAGISADKMAKLQYLLTKGLYKDPITAVIAEWTNNAVDSIVQAGKDPIENPVMVTLGVNSNNQHFFRVEDKGVGLDKDDFENICMNYLESTKENDNNAIGHFGIGMKSFLSLERSATFICRKNGKERVYFVYEGAEFVNYTLVSEVDTKEVNGVIAELVIKDNKEYNTFIEKARQKLAYYDTVALVVNKSPVIPRIYRNDMFQWSDGNKNAEMHLCLKDVYYTIDWEALGIARIQMPIALRFGLDSGLTPTPSRESYITNEATKDLIISRIRQIADWFVNRYNSEQKEFDNLLEAYETIGRVIFNVNVEGATFTVNNIRYHSLLILKEATVKGMVLNTPIFYKNHFSHYFDEYQKVGYKGYYSYKVKRIYATIDGWIKTDKPVILVGDNYKGNVKSYLVDKYQTDTLFVRKAFDRKIGTSSSHEGYTSYRYVLGLRGISKDRWRGLIEEFNLIKKTLICKFVDETDVETTQGYIDWLVKKKKDADEKRRLNRINGIYNGLNKQVGDVTIGYHYQANMGFPFKKKAYPINTLHKNQFLTVYFTEITEEMKGIIRMVRNKYVKFAMMGKKEVTKIPNCKQFISWSKFMTRDCKPFMRLASAILFNKVTSDFQKIAKGKAGIFGHCVSEALEDNAKLITYVNEHYIKIGEPILEQSILDVAEQKDLYDKQLWDVYIRLKAVVKKYDFITCLTEPSSWDIEAEQKYTRIMGQLLLFRKRYYDDLPKDIQITVVAPKEEDDKEGELVEEELIAA